MAYLHYQTWDSVRERLGITARMIPNLCTDFLPIEPSDLLKAILKRNLSLPLGTEKARSEALIAPILGEVQERKGGNWYAYSGYALDADETMGLTGYCDYLISRELNEFEVCPPILGIVEAKNDALDSGVPQCTAQLKGMQLFNHQHGITLAELWGAVTTGLDWRFMKLEGDTLFADKRIYTYSELPTILGILHGIGSE